MRKSLRILLSAVLALLLAVQSFPLSALAAEDASPPVIARAEVRPAMEEAARPLESGQTVPYNAGVYHFLLSDPAEEETEASGVDLAACALTVDGRGVTNLVPDETDDSLSAALTLSNGRHRIALTARDAAGNETSAEYIVLVGGDNLSLPVYTVSAEPDYAPLGGSVRLTIHTPDASGLTALNVRVHGLTGCAQEGFAVEGAAGFTPDAAGPVYDADSHTMNVRVRTSRTLSGERDIAVITIPVDAAAPSGSRLTWAVEAWAESRRADTPDYYEGFSLAGESLPVKAPYQITSDLLYAGMTEKAYLRVKDWNGSPVQISLYYADGTLLGRTNWSGQLTVPESLLAEPGTRTIYASGDLGVSYPTPLTVYDRAEGAATPVLRLASAGDGCVFSWLSPLGETFSLRYAETVSALERAEAIAASAEKTAFAASGELAQVNTVSLTGLTPGRTYYYETSADGEGWSEPRAFTAPGGEDVTRLFVLGDLRGAPEDTAADLIDALAQKQLPLGVFTGDLVSDGGDLAAWQSALNALAPLQNAELFFTAGDREMMHGGSAAQAIFARPAGCASVEYGSVYIASIPYGSRADYRQSLEWLVRDAQASACPWKLLVLHQPPYYTCSDGDNEGLDALVPAYAERAGVQFVFSGHDECFARTPALASGERAASYDDAAHTSLRGDGTVWYLCGSAGAKERPVDASLPFDYTVISDYTAVYLTAEATRDQLTVRAFDVSGGVSREIDSYTMLASECVTSEHVFSEQSVYDARTDTLVCNRCGEAIPAAESGYTGYAAVEGGRAWLENGRAQTGWFTVSGTLFHAGADARIHKTVNYSTETCTEPGERMAWCSECRIAHSYGETVPAHGHSYDSSHHCVNVNFTAAHNAAPCGWTAVDVAQLESSLEYTYGYYTGAALTPAVTVRSPDGAPLTEADCMIAYARNTDIGVASVTITGQGDYYGETVLRFEIRPANVNEITAAEVGETSLTLTWEAAAGAQRYAVYQQTASGWTRLGDTTETRFNVTGLAPGTAYSFRVRPFAIVAETLQRLDGSTDRTYWSPRSSEILSVTTAGTSARFVDVRESDWFASSVAWAVANGVTNGTDATHFTPDGLCTRGQMVTFLWRASGRPEPKGTQSPFTDVADPNAYYYKPVLWAVENGITRGSSPTTFSPDAPVTRGMVVTILHRAAGEQPPKGSASPFVDVPSDQYYAAGVQWAVEQKITDGVDPTHFSPETICTRAQIVTFLARYAARK